MKHSRRAHDNKAVIFSFIVPQSLSFNVLDISEFKWVFPSGPEGLLDLLAENVDVLLVHLTKVLDQHDGIKDLDVFKFCCILMPVLVKYVKKLFGSACGEHWQKAFTFSCYDLLHLSFEPLLPIPP